VLRFLATALGYGYEASAASRRCVVELVAGPSVHAILRAEGSVLIWPLDLLFGLDAGYCMWCNKDSHAAIETPDREFTWVCSQHLIQFEELIAPFV
jgi:hypothetical protein